MTNVIEQTKREMYQFLKHCYAAMGAGMMPQASLPSLENALEAHLEALRKDKGVVQAHLNDKCDQLSRMTEERDTLRNRIQVLEMASETKAEVIRGLMGDVSVLKESLNNASATTHQESAENASGAITGSAMTVLGALIDCRQLVSDWAVYGFKAKKQMRKLADVLNGDPKLEAAMKSFEGSPEREEYSLGSGIKSQVMKDG